MTHIGARLVSIEEGRVRIALNKSERVSQQLGYIHAGATTSIADSAGGYAALTMFNDDEEVLAVEVKVNLLNPAKSDEIIATGSVIKVGRTLAVCHLEVHSVENGEEVLVAVGQQTLIRVKK